MKLISCHIENFGGLSGCDLEFAPDLTVIREENGFGKTTLAEFIRAMFYGFPRKTRTLSKRQKYRPWNGQKCGGHLTFEHEGRTYRIERTFGATPRSDSFNLIDLQTGQKSSDFSEEIGLELFGLDADSFERSTYLPQNRETGPLTTDSIRAKLGGLVEDENDVGSFEKAMKRLREKRSTYIPYTASATRGSVAEAGRQITAVQQALDRAERSGEALTQTGAEIRRLEEERKKAEVEIEQVRADLTAANEAAARLVHRQQADRLEAEYTRTAGELEQLRQQYPKGLPDQRELENIADAVEQLARLNAASPVTAADENAQRYVEENQERFASGVPMEGEIAEMRQVCDDYRGICAQLEACTLSREDEAELAKARAFFAPGVPDPEELESAAAAMEEAEGLRRENLRLAAKTTVTEPKYKVPSPLTVPLLTGLGVAALIAGVVLLIRSVTGPGGIALGVGLLALLAAGYVSLRAAMTRQVPGMDPQLQGLIRENEARAAALEEKTRQFTGRYFDGPPAEGLRLLREQAARLHSLGLREENAVRRHAALTEEKNACNQILRDFFSRYFPAGYSGSGYDLLARLQRESDAWVRALCQLEDRDERVARHYRQTESAKQVLAACRSNYDLLPRNREQVLRLRDDARRLAELEKAMTDLAQQAREYRAAHADVLGAEEPAQGADPALLRTRERQLLTTQNRIGEELLRLRQQRDRLREEADLAPELRDRLARWQEQKAEDQQRAAVLDDTMAFLSQARDELSMAYMGPIRESFTGLMNRMAGESREKILVTPELEVKLERNGESRELAYFSAGQTDLVMLCMRLSLVDALFREAKPFVILDDPFINLDDRRTAEALKLIRELSKDRQIIYLTCNSSRV